VGFAGTVRRAGPESRHRAYLAGVPRGTDALSVWPLTSRLLISWCPEAGPPLPAEPRFRAISVVVPKSAILGWSAIADAGTGNHTRKQCFASVLIVSKVGKVPVQSVANFRIGTPALCFSGLLMPVIRRAAHRTSGQDTRWQTATAEAVAPYSVAGASCLSRDMRRHVFDEGWYCTYAAIPDRHGDGINEHLDSAK